MSLDDDDDDVISARTDSQPDYGRASDRPTDERFTSNTTTESTDANVDVDADLSARALFPEGEKKKIAGKKNVAIHCGSTKEKSYESLYISCRSRTDELKFAVSHVEHGRNVRCATVADVPT